MLKRKNGMILAFEGLDGSGKETQTKLLEERLKNDGIKVLRIDFPNYQSKYSLFVKEYLNGKFDKEMNPYVISTFFALDRLGIYETKMKTYLNEGYVIICDRYVYSNLIYQGCKFDNLEEREKFFDWILNFEYNMCNLLKEEITFFMDVPINISLEIIRSRGEKDIYEKDKEFLIKSYENCKNIAKKYNLVHIECCSLGKLLPINEINDRIYEHVLKILNYEGKNVL